MNIGNKGTSHLERVRQKEFINEMISNGFEEFKPRNYEDIQSNFKKQLEKHNQKALEKKGKTELSYPEFKRLLDSIDKGSTTVRTNKLFQKHEILTDENETLIIELFSKDRWCENIFQIAEEVVNVRDGEQRKETSRFDAVIFINGLPLVIFELKQSGVGTSKGIDQVINYKKKGQIYGLFNYAQIFLASSFSNTRYFANNDSINRNFIFNWTDKDNKQLDELYGSPTALTKSLLQRCNIAEMIARYIIPGVEGKPNVILRPYQVYAVKEILRKVKENSGNGYVFHTTGSGKTITSFKTCKLLSQMPNIDKVIFLVDRQDLDNQTKKAYENFEPGCYDSASNIHELKRNLLANNNQIVVGTIQKMSMLTDENKGKLSSEERVILSNKRTVIVIDECHRSQSGQNTTNIRSVFNKNTQYFGFTGTPIYDENSKIDVMYKTTKSIFDEELHKYTITTAVRDKNVLKFNVQSHNDPSRTYEKMDVTRIEKVSKFIIEKYNSYTSNRKFNAIFATTSQLQLKLYYEALSEYNNTLDDHEKIKFTAIFSTEAGDEDSADKDTEFVDRVINDFNNNFNTNLSSAVIQGFKGKVQDYIRNRELDLVLVVDMLLTGFDSPITNTLFIDKPLKYHNLLQSYSRVNRLENEKPFGQICTFLDQSDDRTDAFRLFAAGGSFTDYQVEDYESVVNRLNGKVALMRQEVATLNEFSNVLNDKNKIIPAMEAVKAVIKDFEYARSHPEFSEEDLEITRVEANDFKNVYREHAKVLKELPTDPPGTQEEQIIEQMDFELHLFEELNIDYNYLIQFLSDNKDNQELCEEKIDSLDINNVKKEILKESYSIYASESEIPLIDIVDEQVELAKYKKYLKHIKENNIEDQAEEFMVVVSKQREGRLLESNATEYTNVLKGSNTWHAPEGMSSLKARGKFKNDSYNLVEETEEMYRME